MHRFFPLLFILFLLSFHQPLPPNTRLKNFFSSVPPYIYTTKYYKGSCGATFKKRFANHKKSFNNDQYKNETELSKSVCNLKSTNENLEIAWEIVRRCTLVNRAILRCNLCLNKKLEIATNQGDRNSFSKCRPFNKF